MSKTLKFLFVFLMFLICVWMVWNAYYIIKLSKPSEPKQIEKETYKKPALSMQRAFWEKHEYSCNSLNH